MKQRVKDAEANVDRAEKMLKSARDAHRRAYDPGMAWKRVQRVSSAHRQAKAALRKALKAQKKFDRES